MSKASSLGCPHPYRPTTTHRAPTVIREAAHMTPQGNRETTTAGEEAASLLEKNDERHAGGTDS